MSQRWIIFTVLALMYMLVYFYRVSLAVVAGDISRELQLTPQQLGSLAGVLFYVYAAAQIPLGPMIDRLGSRLVISVSGILTAIGGILFAQATSLGGAMAARVLIGVGTASVLMAIFTIFSHWFDKREFGKVSGLMVAVGNLGNLAGTAPLALAVAAIGWRSSFLVVGILQVLVTVLVYVVVRDRPASGAAQTEDVKESADKKGMLAAWGDIFGRRDFWLLGIIAFAWYGNYLALQGLWGGPYLMEVVRLSQAETGRVLMFTSLGFIVGSTVVDSIALRFFGSYKKALLAGQLTLMMLMTGFLGWAELLPQPLLMIVFFVIGLTVSSGVMIYPIIRSMFPVQIVGTALTSLNFFVLMGAAAAQQVMGIIVGSYGRGASGIPPLAFHVAFLLPVVCLAIAIILFLFARDYTER
jgi:sugar phosphate permease